MVTRRPHVPRQSIRGMAMLGISILLAVTTAGWCQEVSEEFGPEPIVLQPTGLPSAETPEAVLPAGALFHLRINGARRLLGDASELVQAFIPEKTLPPPLRQALTEPNSLLGLIGALTVGTPLSVDQLVAISGVDPDRPISLSLYPGRPEQAFALTIPVVDLAAFSALMTHLMPQHQVERIKLDGKSIYRIQVPNAHLFVTCADKMVSVCGSALLARQMLIAPPEARLDRSPFIMDTLQQYAQTNLVFVVDASPLKPMLPALRRFARIPDAAISKTRSDLFGELDDASRRQIDHQLRLRMGIRDIEQLADHVECLVTASYEVLFETLLGQATNFNGLAFSIDLTRDFQSIRFSAYSKSIVTDEEARPLPLAELNKIVSKLPGTHNAFVFSRQRQPAQKPMILGNLLDRIGSKMRQKELPLAFYKAMQRAYDACRPEQSLESKVPWMLSAKVRSPACQPPDQYSSMQAFLTALGEVDTAHPSLVKVQAIPHQPKGFLESHFEEQVGARNANDRSYRQWLGDLGAGQPFYLKDSRSSVQQLDRGVTKFTQETSYTTHWGLFGYNEHELINRRFTLAHNLDEYTLLYPGGRDPSVLVDFPPQPMPVAIVRLLAKANVPRGTHNLEVLRFLHLANDAVDMLVSLETLIHRDLGSYLAKAEAIRDEEGTQEEVLRKLVALEMPLEVFQLKIDSDDRLYLTTPVGLTYPRPKIIPEALVLLKDYRAAAESLGGSVVYQRAVDGQYDLVWVQSTEALATLVRTVGNNIVERYLSDAEGYAKLQRLALTPHDHEQGSHPAILTNTLWEMLAR